MLHRQTLIGYLANGLFFMGCLRGASDPPLAPDEQRNMSPVPSRSGRDFKLRMPSRLLST